MSEIINKVVLYPNKSGANCEVEAGYKFTGEFSPCNSYSNLRSCFISKDNTLFAVSSDTINGKYSYYDRNTDRWTHYTKRCGKNVEQNHDKDSFWIPISNINKS